jgi:diguanylate cyclase (GGDEF)-like protein
MPELDGLGVCRRLRDDPLTAEVPIVILTAQNDEASEVSALEAGADDFIAKPPRGAVVRARVRNLVRMKHMSDRLKREARHDVLTGLANRRVFMSTLHAEWLRASRQGKPLSVLMFDVDHFKAFNDHYGHLAGDGALARVGQVLGGAARRPADLPARIGGEEFAVLLPNTDSPGAQAFARNALQALAQAAIPHAASPVASHLSMSVGIATAVPAAGVPSDRDTDMAPLQANAELDIVARADAALYLAKRRGRNRACVDSDPELGTGSGP